MNFGEVLTRAWQITWKHKVLWVFGFLASCGSQSGNGFNYNFSGVFRDKGGDPSDLPIPPVLSGLFLELVDFFSGLSGGEIVLFFGGIILVVFVLAVIAILISTIGRIGLIQGTVQGDQGVASLTFGGLFGQVRPLFLRVLGLNLLIVVAFVALTIIFGLLIANLTTTPFSLGLLCLIPPICILTPVFWFLAVVIEQANVALVADDLGITDALRAGWDVVRGNIGTMIVMTLILSLGVGLIAAFIISLPLIFVAGPAIVGFIVGTGEAVNTGLLIAGICLVLYLPVLLVLSSIFRTYIQSSWTLTYLRLTAATQPGMSDETPPLVTA